VAQWAIANGSNGFVLCDGMGLGQSDGSTTADTAQKAVANGQFSDGTIGTDELPVYAMATEDPAGAAGTFLCIVRCL
jgi:hypothetical protein